LFIFSPSTLGLLTRHHRPLSGSLLMKTKMPPSIEVLVSALARYEKDDELRLIAGTCNTDEGARISASQRKMIILLSDFAVLFKDHEIVKINRTLIKECLSLRAALESRRLVTVYASRGAPGAYLIGHHPGSPKLRTGH